MAKRIQITDGVGHLAERLTLTGDVLTGETWLTSLLLRNGAKVDDSMSARDVADEVYDAYSGDGYDGDPEANGLRVLVEDI